MMMPHHIVQNTLAEGLTTGNAYAIAPSGSVNIEAQPLITRCSHDIIAMAAAIVTIANVVIAVVVEPQQSWS